MAGNSLNNMTLLDRILNSDGTDRLKVFFHRLCKTDIQKALQLVNSKSLHYASLFILQPEIEKLDLFYGLNSRNKIALEITSEILTGKESTSVIKSLLSNYIQLIHSVLKWMFETGARYDGLNNQYDKVLDTTAALLINVYRDKTVLPVIADITFERYKKGFFIHNLVWTFFEARDPLSLILVAERLDSKYPKEVELACKLLNFVPGIDRSNPHIRHISFLNWLQENALFLYYTGESFQQKSNPKPYAVSLEAKYLCTAVSCDTGKILKHLTREEHELLHEFNKLNNKTKVLLSDFSFMMHCKNIHSWNVWLHYPISHQIKVAEAGGIE